MQFLSNKKSVVFILVLSSLFFFNSCQKPDTKEEYLNKFRNFVGRVDRYHEDYTKNDWEWAEERFKLYSSDWYDEFEGELSAEEKIEVIALKLEYRSMEKPGIISELLNDLKDEEDELRQKIDEYIEKDFEEDMEELIDGMAEIGDSAVKVFEDILENIDTRF